MAESKTFGECFAHHRRSQVQLSLRRFCEAHGFDPGNISKLERGVLPPPQDRSRLTQYAGALGLGEGSDEWYEFFDLAAAAHGQIPQDLVDDEALLRSLPVLFRSSRTGEFTAEDARGLMDLIRKS